MGLIDEETYAVTSTIEKLRAAYDSNKDGAISAAEGADEYAAAIWRLTQAVERLQATGQDVTLGSLSGAVGGIGGGAGGSGSAIIGGANNVYSVTIQAGTLLSFTDEQGLKDKLAPIIREVVNQM
jgi:hypothetical protein